MSRSNAVPPETINAIFGIDGIRARHEASWAGVLERGTRADMYRSDVGNLLAETERLTAELAAMTAERDAMRERAEAKRTCEGCVERGKWENEIEYGYSCPCLACARRASDNWRGPGEDEPNDTKEARNEQ